jgi:exonuclease III
LKIATWNVRSLGTKEIELDNELKEKKINIAIITETKKKNLKETKDLE